MEFRICMMMLRTPIACQHLLFWDRYHGDRLPWQHLATIHWRTAYLKNYNIRNVIFVCFVTLYILCVVYGVRRKYNIFVVVCLSPCCCHRDTNVSPIVYLYISCKKTKQFNFSQTRFLLIVKDLRNLLNCDLKDTSLICVSRYEQTCTYCLQEVLMHFPLFPKTLKTYK